MVGRSSLQTFTVIVFCLGACPALGLADTGFEGSEVVEVASEIEISPDREAVSAEAPSQTSSDAADDIFGDQLDPLFDDDFDFEPQHSYPDPLEETNRAIFSFNQALDAYLLGPITSFFGYVTPEPLKLGLRNFFANLNMPVVLINDMLQLEWRDATITTAAFVVNTSVGLAGLFEPGKLIGIPRHESDFGQTLALARVPSGPYLMLPITGPSTARGTVGSVVDFFMRPNTWLLPVSNFYYYGGEGMVTLEHHREKLQELERSSVDFYSVMRSAYYQTRSDQIWGRRQDRRPPELD